MSRVHFYASAGDIMGVCKSVEEKMDLKIIPAFSTPASQLPQKITEYFHFSDVPDLGKAASGYPPLCKSYVLINRDKDMQPKFRFTGGPNGEKIAYLNSTIDEESVELRPGGEFGDNAIILGEILNSLTSKASERIIRAFRSEFGKKFIAKSGREWIGSEALSRLKLGARLTPLFDHPNPDAVDVKINKIEPEKYRY